MEIVSKVKEVGLHSYLEDFDNGKKVINIFGKFCGGEEVEKDRVDLSP